MRERGVRAKMCCADVVCAHTLSAINDRSGGEVGGKSPTAGLSRIMMSLLFRKSNRR